MANNAFLLVLKPMFRFKVLYKRKNASWSHVLGISNILQTQGNTSVKKKLDIRCVELNVKQENDVLSQKGAYISKISRFHIMPNAAFPPLFGADFHFKVLYKRENESWSHVLDI